MHLDSVKKTIQGRRKDYSSDKSYLRHNDHAYFHIQSDPETTPYSVYKSFWHNFSKAKVPKRGDIFWGLDPVLVKHPTAFKIEARFTILREA